MKPQKQDIDEIIIDSVKNHTGDLISHVALVLSLSPRTVFNHVKRLVNAGVLSASGRTKGRRYALTGVAGPWRETVIGGCGPQPKIEVESVEKRFIFPVSKQLQEDEVWRRYIEPELSDLPENVRGICRHGVTEMVNNVIDHSSARGVTIELTRIGDSINIVIEDDGIGIFERIRAALNLADYKEASLELYKGKFTTDPDRHSGEGIFFTSRAFDGFAITSNGCVWRCGKPFGEEVVEGEKFSHNATVVGRGTWVLLRIKPDASRKLTEVFDEFSAKGAYSFDRTTFPLRAAETATGPLVSRSQAKRVLARLEDFKEVTFDFSGVSEIGQAFADEMFRVFRSEHPKVRFNRTNAVAAVEGMIRRAEDASQSAP